MKNKERWCSSMDFLSKFLPFFFMFQKIIIGFSQIEPSFVIDIEYVMIHIYQNTGKKKQRKINHPYFWKEKKQKYRKYKSEKNMPRRIHPKKLIPPLISIAIPRIIKKILEKENSKISPTKTSSPPIIEHNGSGI